MRRRKIKRPFIISSQLFHARAGVMSVNPRYIAMETAMALQPFLAFLPESCSPLTQRAGAGTRKDSSTLVKFGSENAELILGSHTKMEWVCLLWTIQVGFFCQSGYLALNGVIANPHDPWPIERWFLNIRGGAFRHIMILWSWWVNGGCCTTGKSTLSVWIKSMIFTANSLPTHHNQINTPHRHFWRWC